MHTDEKSELYVRLNYTQYKALQAQLQDWDSIESSHTSVEGFYHKALRLEIGSMILEIQGPTVKKPIEEPSPRICPDCNYHRNFCRCNIKHKLDTACLVGYETNPSCCR